MVVDRWLQRIIRDPIRSRIPPRPHDRIVIVGKDLVPMNRPPRVADREQLLPRLGPGFTVVTITGTIQDPHGSAVPAAAISFTLSQPITDGSTLVDTQTASATSDAGGAFSIPLTATDDPTTTPTGAFYLVQVGDWDSFNVIVPHTLAPTAHLLTLPRV